jgi:AraC-like DNA-binding protein
MKETLSIPAGLDGEAWHYHWTNYVHFPHRHDELESNLIVRGTAKYILGERRYDLARNTQIWFFREQEHLLFDKSPDFEMWILVFRSPLVRKVCGKKYRVLLEDDPGYFCKPLAEHQAARLRKLYDELREVKEDPARFNAGLGYALLSAWSAQCAEERITPSFDIHPAVERAARLIHDETEPVGIEELGAKAGLSASRLSRLFKEQTGVSLVEYRNKERLKRFLALYDQGRQISMMDAALSAGFGSYPQFHRIFKQLMGCGPAEYRRKVQ